MVKRKASELSKLTWVEDHVAAADLAYKKVSTSDIVDPVRLADTWLPLKTLNTAQGLSCKLWMSAENGNVLVAFRGTASLKELKVDAKVGLTPFKTSKGVDVGHVHRGIGESWVELEQRLTSELNSLKEVHCLPDGASLQFAGHSLGGALADLATTYYADQFPRVEIVTTQIGVPRIGDDNYIAYARSQKNARRTRIMTLNDPVNKYSLPSLKHVEEENVITLDARKKKKPKFDIWGAVKTGAMMLAPGVGMITDAMSEGLENHQLGTYQEVLTNFTDQDRIETVDNPRVQQQKIEDDTQERKESEQVVSLDECKCECHQHDAARANGLPPPTSLAVSEMPDLPTKELGAPNPTITPTMAQNMMGDAIQTTKMEEDLEEIVEDQQEVVDDDTAAMAEKVNEAMEILKAEDQEKLDRLHAEYEELTGYGLEDKDANPFEYTKRKEAATADTIRRIEERIQMEMEYPQYIDPADTVGKAAAEKYRAKLNSIYTLMLSASSDSTLTTPNEDDIKKFRTQMYERLAGRGVLTEDQSGTGTLFDMDFLETSAYNQKVTGGKDDFIKHYEKYYETNPAATEADKKAYEEESRSENLEWKAQKKIFDASEYTILSGQMGNTENLKKSPEAKIARDAAKAKMDSLPQYDQKWDSMAKWRGEKEYMAQRQRAKYYMSMGGGDPMGVYEQMKDQLSRAYKRERMTALKTHYDAQATETANAQGTGKLQQRIRSMESDMEQQTERRMSLTKKMTSHPQFAEVFKNAKINIQDVLKDYTSEKTEDDIMTALGLKDPEVAKQEAWMNYTQKLSDLSSKGLANDEYLTAVKRLQGEYTLKSDYHWLRDEQSQEIVDKYVKDPAAAEKALASYQQKFWQDLNTKYGGVYNITGELDKPAITLPTGDITQIDKQGEFVNIDKDNQRLLFEEWARNPDALKEYLKQFQEQAEEERKSTITNLFTSLGAGASAGSAYGPLGTAAGAVINPQLWGAVDKLVRDDKRGWYGPDGTFYGFNTSPDFVEFVRRNPDLGFRYEDGGVALEDTEEFGIASSLYDQAQELILLSRGLPPITGTSIADTINGMAGWGTGVDGTDKDGDGLPEMVDDGDIDPTAALDLGDNLMYYALSRRQQQQGGDDDGQPQRPPNKQNDLRILGETNLVSKPPPPMPKGWGATQTQRYNDGMRSTADTVRKTDPRISTQSRLDKYASTDKYVDTKTGVLPPPNVTPLEIPQFTDTTRDNDRDKKCTIM